jgi:hypothetical protein
MQAALVKWGCKEVLGRDMTEFSFVFVEKEPPHCVDVLVLDPEDIEAAEHDLRMALRTLAYCLKTGDWFGPSGSSGTPATSAWATVRATAPCPARIS